MAIEEYNQEQLKPKKVQKQEYSATGTKSVYSEYGKIDNVKKVSTAIKITVTVIGAGLILASVGGFTFGYKPTAKVSTFELTAGTDHIDYNVTISESKADSLIIQIHNQFIKRQEEITVGENVGSFTDLKPGMQYKISIIENKVLVTSKNLFTLYEQGGKI